MGKLSRVSIWRTNINETVSIQNGLLYAFLKFARFMIDFGLVYVAESPIYSQDGVYYYPSDPKIPGTDFRVGMNPDKKFKRYKGLTGKV